MQKRKYYHYDLLRALAILLVILQHSVAMLDMDTEQWGTLCYIYRTLVTPGVVAFVVLSGALQLDAPIRPMREFYTRRLTRILVPFLIWGTAVFVISVFVHKYDEINSWTDAITLYPLYLASNRINEAFWFVFLILLLYFLTPFIQRAFSQCSKRSIEVLLLVWLLGLLSRSFFPELFFLKYTSGLFYYLGCYVAGYYFKHYHISGRMQWAGLAAFFALGTLDILTQTQLSFIRPLMAIALFVTFNTKSETEPSRFLSPMFALSRYSYMAYLVHLPVVAAVIQALSLQASPDQMLSSAYLPLLLGVLVVVIVMFACRVTELIQLPNSLLKHIGISPEK